MKKGGKQCSGLVPRWVMMPIPEEDTQKGRQAIFQAEPVENEVHKEYPSGSAQEEQEQHRN